MKFRLLITNKAVRRVNKMRKKNGYSEMSKAQIKETVGPIMAKIYSRANAKAKFVLITCYSFEKHELNMLTYKYFIMVSPEWTALMCCYPEEKVVTAFKAAFAHELSHYEYPEGIAVGCSSKFRFRRYVSEVYADISGAAKAQLSKEELMEVQDTMNYLKDPYLRYADSPRKAKKTAAWMAKPSKTHPTRDVRKEFAETGCFSPDTIRKIAEMLDYSDQTFIDELCGRYCSIDLAGGECHA